MGLLSILGVDPSTTDAPASEPTPADDATRVRCRGCGRYYDLPADRCPHCGSGNAIRQGAPAGQTRR